MKCFVQIERKFFQRLGLRKIPQVFEHALHLLELALNGAPEALAVIQVVEHLDDQLAAVADVLDRMREVMDQADGNTTKDRLSLCLSDVLLQLDEPVGHVIEGMSELAEFIGRVDSHTL